MRAWIWAGFALAAAAPVYAADSVVVPEGWYRLEEGTGEADDSIAMVIVEPVQGQAQPPPSAPPDIRAEVEEFLRIDCEAVRGRYLQRLLQLHGVNVFSLEQDLLAVWTHRRPSQGGVGWPFPLSALSDPALAPLYGEPPVPPGALSYDFELQGLARDLLRCEADAARSQPRSSAQPTPPPSSGSGSGGSGLDQREATPQSL